MNSFRSVERAIEFEIERQAARVDAGETLARRRAAGPTSAARRTVMRAKEIVGRLPVLPGARPAAAALDPAWLDRDRGRTARAPGRAPGALRRRRSGCRAYDAARAGGRPGRCGAVRRDPRRRRRRCPPSRSPTGSPGSTCACVTPRHRDGRQVGPAELAHAIVGASRIAVPGERQGGAREHVARGRRRQRRSSRTAGYRQISDDERDRRDRRRGAGRQPNRRRRLPAGKAAGDRVPGRARS